MNQSPDTDHLNVGTRERENQGGVLSFCPEYLRQSCRQHVPQPAAQL